MKSLLDNLIGHMWAVIVARVDVVHASGNRFSQTSDRSVNVPWRSPNFRAGKLHRAVAHPVQGGCGAWECEGATEFGLFRHCVFPPISGSLLVIFLAGDISNG